MMQHALGTAPFWLSVAGIGCAWFLYIARPAVPARIAATLNWLYTLLSHKYYFDEFNEFVFARGGRGIGQGLWQFGDVRLIDGVAVNGSAALVGWFAGIVRRVQSGYLYHYAFAMILGLLGLLGYLYYTYDLYG
jgi:NADH-quinone oxidoreductase subunit L